MLFMSRCHISAAPRFGEFLKFALVVFTLVSIFCLFRTPFIILPVKPALLDIQGIDQLDPRLWEHIRINHVFPPSTLEYGFDIGKKKLAVIDPQLDSLVQELFKDKRSGIFVEVGAFDGIWSHTLILEKEMNWTGLLIECHPTLLKTLKAVNRKAYLVDLCLSRGKHPEKAKLTSLDAHTGSSSLGNDSHLFPSIQSNVTVFEVQTIPLFSIMAAVNLTTVDLFILDIQSLEVDVLNNFPFDRVLVKVWVVEVYFLGAAQREDLRRFMENKGYSKDRFWSRGMDYIFVHKSFVA